MYISKRPSTDFYRYASDLPNHSKVQPTASQPVNGQHRDATVERGCLALPGPQSRLEKQSSSVNQQKSHISIESSAGNAGRLQGRTAQLTAAYQVLAESAAYQALAEDEARQGVRGQVVREEVSLHSQQAIMAYQFHENLTERDRIVSVLGIDEYA